MDHPFIDDFPEFLKLQSRDCMNVGVAETSFTEGRQKEAEHAEYRWNEVTDRLK